MYKIEFTKSARTVDCSGQMTVLEAAQEAGLPDLPYSCQGGTCRTCAVKGEGEMETEEMLALTPAEILAGWRLTCVAYPRGDCKFDL
ncbi:MAG TPA: 2Fe-2S iron-sulfur cluster-binding protein [bacterium]|nr:2Fe-2S iron-sulfur cluster-binding protein [bacterium]